MKELLWVSFIIPLAMGCQQKMTQQPKYLPYDPSDFFANGMSSRPIIPGTIARGQPRTDLPFYTGKVNGVSITTLPIPLTAELLKRGQQRFNIYCSPCHGESGNGQGMIVARGFTAPPSYHTEELRKAPIGHFFDVITRGYGVMYSYASRIPIKDRWAISAYIRALQLSQNAKLENLSHQDQMKLENIKR